MSPAMPRTKVVAVLLSGQQTYLQYVRALAPVLWFRLNETAGSTAVNSGTGGAAFDGTYSGCVLGQAGKMSATGAVLFDGSTSLIAVPAGAHGNYQALTRAYLVNTSGAGEANAGAFKAYASSTNQRFAIASGKYRSDRATGGSSITNENAAHNAWRWLFEQLDMSGDKKVHVFLGVNGTLTEFTYSTQNAVTATFDQTATALTLGNYADGTRTMAGLMDEALVDNKIWTPAQMLQLVRLTNV